MTKINKTELCKFHVSNLIRHECDGKTFVTAYEKNVSTISSLTDQEDSNREQADTRILLHLINAVQICLHKTVDAGVIAVALTDFQNLLSLIQDISIWIEFRKGMNVRCFHINKIYGVLGNQNHERYPCFTQS